MIHIRTAIPSDIDALYPLFLELVETEDAILRTSAPKLMKARRRRRNFEECAKRKLREEIEQKQSLFLVALENNTIIGYGFGAYELRKEAMFHDHRRGFVYTLIVKKEFRGRGIASKLHNQLLAWLKKKKCDVIFIGLFQGNFSHDIYKNWGYRDCNIDMVR